MKKYLFLTLAAFAFAACTEKDIDDNASVQTGEIEESYIAINLSASDVTRAETTTPEFEDGEAAERAVNHVDFFFFDEAGNPFNVVGNPAVAPGGGINHLRAANVTFSADANTDDDISDTSTPVLLLKTYKGQYPSQIVAVLNWSPDNKAYSLEELHTAVAIQGTFKNTQNEDTKYFVMSNAVYASSGKTVNATALPESCIKKTANEALDEPISIYVERVAAKVTVSTNGGGAKIKLSNTGDDTFITIGELVQKDVYAQLLGWELYNDNTKSYLLKQVDPIWTAENIGFNWNDTPWYRSYWATSLPRPTDESNSFQMEYEEGKIPAGFANKYGFAMGGATYVGENTNGKQDGTKVILKAKLVDEAGNALEIASWYGNKYIGEVSLRTAVANTLKYTLFYYDAANSKYIGITPEDLQCVAGGTTDAPKGVAANEVYFQLSDETGCGKNRIGGWYKLVDGEYKPVATDLNSDTYSVEATNGYLKTIQPGILYKSGETFYYVDIKHLGANNSVAEYGVVRNHIYNVIIKSIGGYGSPVYVGTSNIIDPQYPDIEDAEETFVSAQINILSWRLVNQEVDIQPNN